MSKSRHVTNLQGMVLCHSTGRETEAQETNFPITLTPPIETKGVPVWNGRTKGIGMAPKACVELQIKGWVWPGKTQRAAALLCQAHTKSLSPHEQVQHTCSSVKFIPALHCWLTSPLQQGRGDGFTLMCIPGSRRIPRGAAWFIFNDTSPSL